MENVNSETTADRETILRRLTWGYLEAMTGSEILKEYRLQADYTQEQLARAMKVHTSSVAQWEAGKTVPRRDKAVRMDKLLKAQGAIIKGFGYAGSAGDFVTRSELDGLLTELRGEVDRLRVEFQRMAELSRDYLTEEVEEAAGGPPTASATDEPPTGETRH